MFRSTWAAHSDQHNQRQHDSSSQTSEHFNDFFLKRRVPNLLHRRQMLWLFYL